MFRDFQGTLEQIKIFQSMGERVYRELSERQGYPAKLMYRSQYDHDIADALAKLAQKAGYDASRRCYQESDLTHSHVGVGTEWLVDADWQLFLPTNLENPVFPRILITRRSMIEPVLLDYGIDPHHLRLWTFAVPVD